MRVLNQLTRIFLTVYMICFIVSCAKTKPNLIDKNDLRDNEVSIDSINNLNQNVQQKRKSGTNSQIKKDCSAAVENSSSRYPIRISGESNGCIGDGCEEIPSDSNLYKALQLLKEDFNNDLVIDQMDLAPAIQKTGDVNKDSEINIYDIVYPMPIKYSTKINNVALLNDDGTEYELMGEISKDGSSIVLNYSVDIIYPNNGDGEEDYHTDKRSEIILAGNIPEIILYRKMNVVLKGKLLSGNSRSYEDGFLFLVDKIIGVVK